MYNRSPDQKPIIVWENYYKFLSTHILGHFIKGLIHKNVQANSISFTTLFNPFLFRYVVQPVYNLRTFVIRNRHFEAYSPYSITINQTSKVILAVATQSHGDTNSAQSNISHN